MRLSCAQGDPSRAVSFVKGILPVIGNICSFDLYGDPQASPYESVENGHRLRYTFVLRDEGDTQVWLDTLCGYSGAGPAASERILQILGLKQDFEITSRHEIHETDLKPIHRVNLLVGNHDARWNWHMHFSACLEFAYAHHLWATLNALESIGHLHPASDTVNAVLPAQISMTEPSDELYYADYATNKSFIVNWELRSLTHQHLKEIVTSICRSNRGSLQIEE